MSARGFRGGTRLYGLVGHPVSHSLSPAMHNAAYAAAGMDAAYVAMAVAPERLGEALRGAHALGFEGLNVTVPHKQRAAELCLRRDAVAEACGAANTLRRLDDGWEGLNTDAPACLALLQDAGVRPGAGALLLGAGGAALAAAWALLTAGCSLDVAARRVAAGEAVAARMASAFPDAPPVRVHAWGDLGAQSAAAQVVVNGTSVGLGGSGDDVGVPLRRGQVVADLVYGDTPFARRARAAGATVVTGEAILVRQGALAFTLWTGRPAPEAAMAAALRAARDET